MKIEFTILWLDDNEGFMDSIKDEIHEHLEEHGMQSNIEYLNPKNPDVVKIKVASINPYLIILDYNLEDDLKGDTIIKALRENKQHHDILFYTQDGFEEDTFSSFFKSPDTPLATGINFCNKTSSKDRICALIDLKLSHYADLSTQRGWIVADAIELEQELNELMIIVSQSINKVFSDTVQRVLEDPRSDFGFRASLFNGMLKDYLKVLRSNEPKHSLIEPLAIIKELASSFSEEIIEIRNSIAHQKHTVEADGKITIKQLQRRGEPIEYNQEFLKTVRCSILKHRQNFEELRSALA